MGRASGTPSFNEVTHRQEIAFRPSARENIVMQPHTMYIEQKTDGNRIYKVRKIIKAPDRDTMTRSSSLLSPLLPPVLPRQRASRSSRGFQADVAHPALRPVGMGWCGGFPNTCPTVRQQLLCCSCLAWPWERSYLVRDRVSLGDPFAR